MSDKKFEQVTDKIHDLLNGNAGDNGQFGDNPAQGTVRMTLDVPKAWVLLGAFIAGSKRDANGVLHTPALSQLMAKDGSFPDRSKVAAQREIEQLVYLAGHELLQAVCLRAVAPFFDPNQEEEDAWTEVEIEECDYEARMKEPREPFVLSKGARPLDDDFPF